MGGREGGQVAGGAGVADGMAVLVHGGLGEHAGELDLAGAGPPVGGLAGPAGGLGAHHGYPGAVDRDVQLVRQGCRRQRNQGAGQDRPGLRLDHRGGCRAAGFGGPLDPLGGQLDAGQLGQQTGRSGERLRGAGPGHHLGQPRRQRGTGDAEFLIFGGHAVAAAGAVVVGAAHLDRAEHGADGLGPVADELRLVPGVAIDPLAAMPGIQAQQALQQRAAQPGHRGADRQLHRLQPLGTGSHRAGGQRAGGERRQPLYLGGELRLDLRAEPPFSAPVPAGGPCPAAGSAGRASQIASLTSTICSDSAVNRW